MNPFRWTYGALIDVWHMMVAPAKPEDYDKVTDAPRWVRATMVALIIVLGFVALIAF